LQKVEFDFIPDDEFNSLLANSGIIIDPIYAYYYAVDVIKGRWLEAEPIIKHTCLPIC